MKIQSIFRWFQSQISHSWIISGLVWCVKYHWWSNIRLNVCVYSVIHKRLQSVIDHIHSHAIYSLCHIYIYNDAFFDAFSLMIDQITQQSTDLKNENDWLNEDNNYLFKDTFRMNACVCTLFDTFNTPLINAPANVSFDLQCLIHHLLYLIFCYIIGNLLRNYIAPRVRTKQPLRRENYLYVYYYSLGRWTYNFYILLASCINTDALRREQCFPLRYAPNVCTEGH